MQAGTTLAPGQSEPVRTVITDPVTAGPWTATITLTSGLLSETYTAPLTFPDTPGAAPAAAASPQDPSTDHTALTYLIITGCALLFAAALLLLIRRRRSRKHRLRTAV